MTHARRTASRPAHVALMLGALLLAACGGPPTDPDSGEEIFFPQHDGPPGSGPAALVIGTLRLENGCLLIEADDTGEENLVLWPQGWSVESSPDGIRVEDLTGDGAGIGDRVEVGGGQMDASFAEELIREPIPHRCTSDVYWFATGLSVSADDGG